MIDNEGSSLLTQEQINRLTEASQLAAEAARIEARRKLQEELRQARYADKWIKPFDLWTPHWKLFLVAIIHALVMATFLAVALQNAIFDCTNV